jgi:predicted HTH domain antitoxin
MNVTIPDELASSMQMSEADLRLELAVALYRDVKVTLGQASKLAGLSQAALMRELGRRNVPMSYGIDDLDEDLRNLAELRQG